MKKVFNILACLLLVVCSVTLVACGCHKDKTNDYITPSSVASFAGSNVEFKNDESFKLIYDGHNSYHAEGKAAKMSAEQATTWGTVEGSKYIVVNVKMGVDGSAIIGWRNKETAGTAYKESEIDGSLIKRSTAKNESKNYILALSDGDTARHPDLKIWRIEVTEKDATESVAYTIDFSRLYE